MDLTAQIFHDEVAAREHLEATRWPHGAICPHCGTVGEATKLQGKAHRKGAWQCNACREQFTVTVKTVFERSKLPLSKWLAAPLHAYGVQKGRVGPSNPSFAWHFIQERMVYDAPPSRSSAHW